MNATTVTFLVHIIHRYFIWIIASSYILAALFPWLGLWLRDLNLGSINIFDHRLVISLPPILLASLLFNAGLGVKTTELKHVLRKPAVLVGGVFGNLATPLAFIIAISFAMRSWHNADEAQQILVGLALVASMPIAGASTAWAQNANGNLALSLGLVLATTLLSPLLTPLVLHAAGFVTTGDYSDDLHELAAQGAMSFLGLWVILPSLLGILTQWLVGLHRIAAVMPYLKFLNYGILVLLNYSNASLTLPSAASQPDIDFLALTLVIVLALCIIAFFSGYLLARIFRTDDKGTVSLMFGLGMNNNGTGLVLASLALSDHTQVMLPIIFYNLIQHLVASSVDLAIFRRPSAVS
ncbi:MAG: Na+-dependent transporter [Methylococcaceae bacterium]|nr:Na+-dependent transporter [Methylococcaceae bacterium]